MTEPLTVVTLRGPGPPLESPNLYSKISYLRHGEDVFAIISRCEIHQKQWRRFTVRPKLNGVLGFVAKLSRVGF